MSFQNLKVEELVKVAKHFNVDVVTAEKDKEPTKKELLAALAAGDDPVTWDDYKEYYVPAQKSENTHVEPVNGEDEEAQARKAEEAVAEVEEPAQDENTEEHVLVKYERKNPSYQVVGYSFSIRHPFQSVPVSVAEYLIRQQEGFRLALPSEVTDYYGK